MQRSITPSVLILLVTSACASTGSPTMRAAGATPASVATRQLPNDVRWFRTSAEYRAIARQTYLLATDRLPELSRGLAPQTWAVILDADETVLDNSEYEQRRFAVDSGYTDASWNQWVNERAAVAIPGAVDFTRRVHDLGGRVVIVTNRAAPLCGATRENLRSVGVVTDLVLCEPGTQSDKNPRFESVQRGTAAPNLPPLTVVAWVGDNIQDFPALSQASRTDPAAIAQFGRRFFVLPNPMYGSWQTR
jgi:5'-nucleotidase (lipoprotein e(P4) family)